MAGGWWLTVGDWWLAVGDWQLVVEWWLAADGIISIFHSWRLCSGAESVDVQVFHLADPFM